MTSFGEDVQFQLQRQTARAQIAEDKIAMLEKRTRDAEWEQETTRAHYKAELEIRNQMAEQLTAKIAECTRLSQLFAKADDDLRAATHEKSVLESEIYGLKAHIEDAEERAAKGGDQSAALKEQLAEATIKFERKTEKKRHYKKELEFLQEEAESLRAGLAQYKTLSGQEMTARVEAQRELREWRAAAESATTRLRTTSVAVAVTMKAYRCSTIARQYLLRQIELKKNEVTSAQSSAQIKVKSSQQQVEKFERQAQEAQKATRDVTARLEESTQEFTARVKVLEAKNGELET